MNLSKHKLLDFDNSQRHHVHAIFKEIEECGPHFMSFVSFTNHHEIFYVSNTKNWERVFKEENLIEKDSINYLEETNRPRKWICWDNLPKTCDPHHMTKRRIEICKTIKSASFVTSRHNCLHMFNFGFDRDIDIEKFIWENELLLENYALGLARFLFNENRDS